MKKTPNILCAVLALCLVFTLAAPALAQEQPQPENRQTITISSREDLLALSQNCALDSWSRDKDVVLTQDISLTGLAFSPIPSFGGHFDGQGHTISGLNIRQATAPAGLFSTIQTDALVENLTVKGEVIPDGDGLNVGGIVGSNQGTLNNCHFEGIVTGKVSTGGIAGENSGTIRSSTAAGAVTGHSRTGGIAGYCTGTIDGCQNQALVNTESVDPTVSVEDLHFDFSMDLTHVSNRDSADAPTDTGGIAGYCTGTIEHSTNLGSVGYPHVGYNLGGIAGRSCGLVTDCQNQALITGRKDVGGIVGQIEPHIQTVLSPDYLDSLSRQFENLGGLVSRAGSSGANMGSDVQGCIQSISGYQSSARDSLESLVSGAIDGDIDENALSDLGDAIHGMAESSGNLRNAIGDGVDSLFSDISAIADQIGSISRTFGLATEEAQKELVTDLSDVDLDSISQGRVVSSSNLAQVEGDLNVGGITGIMGLESTADPEDDLPGGQLTQRRRYELKAIVQDCENTGVITGKRSYIGGICGRMELGLIVDSRGYGEITSENGDYVGGIAGITGGTVRSCLAKCTLAGRSRVGGIVGSGITEDASGDTSTVTGCYAMVEIPQPVQYMGAISGMNAGTFSENFFVSDDLAGINRVSYFALAQPITYQELLRKEALPQPLKGFTLRFVVDDETVKTVPFRYGESFGPEIFPELPQKEGCYARWSTTDLSDLRFDTQVEAAYYPYITALRSQQTRDNSKPLIFVQGQFQEGDLLGVSPGTTPFPESQAEPLLEQWHISIPADGQASHTLRYLPTREDTQVYVLRNGSWEIPQLQDMGSYLAFQAPGAEVEIAVTAPTSGTYLWLLVVGIALVVLLIVSIVLFRKFRKTHPRKPGSVRRWLVPLLLALACIGALSLWLFFPETKAGQSLRAYDLLKSYLEQPRQSMTLEVKSQVEDKTIGFTADIHRLPLSGTHVTVISQGSRQLYYARDMVLLENGAAFRLNAAAPDYSSIMEQVLAIYQKADIQSQNHVFTISAQGDSAREILRLLMPSAQSLLPDANTLTVDLITQDDEIAQVRFTGAGHLTDSVQTPFSLSAQLTILPPAQEVTIPEPVEQAITTGMHPQELYSDDLVELLEALGELRGQDPVTADVTVSAQCGPLDLSQDFRFYQWRTTDAPIRAVEREDRTLYFTGDALCDEAGRSLPLQDAPERSAAQLLDIALDSVENTQFQCRHQDGSSIYSFTLNSQGVAQMVQSLFPKTEELSIDYADSTLELTICQGHLTSLTITCGGSGQLLSLPVEVQLGLEAQVQPASSGKALPDAVVQALHPQES